MLVLTEPFQSQLFVPKNQVQKTIECYTTYEGEYEKVKKTPMAKIAESRLKNFVLKVVQKAQLSEQPKTSRVEFARFQVRVLVVARSFREKKNKVKKKILNSDSPKSPLNYP